jgi:glycosyltransferase involved in cell wall biosynthesis
VVDADDDDERLQRDLGHDELASAHARLTGVVLPAARAVFAAGAPDAEALTRRHRLDPPAAVVPNAAPPAPTDVGPPSGGRRALFVANLTYEPNVAGARWLVDEVLGNLGQDWRIDLVGEAVDEVAGLAGPRVGVHGRVDDLTPWYTGADVVVVPLHHGAGSRIKVLEAFARRRPVVATTVGVAGLEVVAGEHALVADDPVGFARAVESAGQADVAARLAAAGAEVGARHAPEVVVPLVAQRLAAAFGL